MKYSEPIKFNGIGTVWYLEFFQDIDAKLIDDIKEIVHQFELKYSRFLENSEVSQLNQFKYLKNPSEDLINMLILAEEAKEISNGAFDITIGGILEDQGYNSKKSLIPKTIKTNSIGEVYVSKDEIKISKDSRIDLGGVGKGYLVDKVSKYLIQNGVKYFLVNAGGDVFATSDNEESIEFALESPFENDQYIGNILIKNQSIASSANNKRRWNYDGKEYAHIVNITSFKSILKHIKAVYIIGNSCTQTDLASTSLFVSNPNLREKIAHHFEIDYLILFDDHTYEKSSRYPAKLF